MAVCQSLQTTIESVPGEKGSMCSAHKAALLNSRKRFWLSTKSLPLFWPYSFEPVLPHTWKGFIHLCGMVQMLYADTPMTAMCLCAVDQSLQGHLNMIH